MLHLKMSWCLANVVHPAVILLRISNFLSLSQTDVAFNTHDMSVVDIYWCVGLHHHLYPSTCSSSEPDCDFLQLIPQLSSAN